jgi:hypothetical protein
VRHCGDCGREVGRYFQYCELCSRKRRLESYARYGKRRRETVVAPAVADVGLALKLMSLACRGAEYEDCGVCPAECMRRDAVFGARC